MPTSARATYENASVDGGAMSPKGTSVGRGHRPLQIKCSIVSASVFAAAFTQKCRDAAVRKTKVPSSMGRLKLSHFKKQLFIINCYLLLHNKEAAL